MAKALALERRLAKDQVLGLYLTLAPFGGNLEGVRAASLAYFGKEPTRLSAAEARCSSRSRARRSACAPTGTRRRRAPAATGSCCAWPKRG